ncbi:unnamed protein product [Phytophthora fragariaefolia]|uniref:Unnamed protein product n=1 Tax=Phytophthora fragariaefolia TaxID=1490495 RepID=A0A9W6Y4E3_9STRA|nr:unnamed protein product [Phytophthora fragariaefolia]
MIRTLGPDPTINNSGRSSELPPVRLAVGVEAAGRRRMSGPPDSVDHLEAVERLQTAEFAALRQELALLKAQIAQVSQTASNVEVDRVANRTNEPTLNSLVFPLLLLSAFSLCPSTEAAMASWTNRVTDCRRWTKSTAF